MRCDKLKLYLHLLHIMQMPMGAKHPGGAICSVSPTPPASVEQPTGLGLHGFTSCTLPRESGKCTYRTKSMIQYGQRWWEGQCEGNRDILTPTSHPSCSPVVVALLLNEAFL